MISYFVEDDSVLGGHSLRVTADIGESEESEVRGGKPQLGIAILTVSLCHQRKDIEVPLDLLTSKELQTIASIGLEES